MSSIGPAQLEGRAPVVLQVLPSLEPGGNARSAIDIARAIVEAGAESLLASAGGPLASDLLRAGATAFELPLTSRSSFLLGRVSRRLARIIRRRRVDIVHARGPGATWAAWRAAMDAGANFLLTFDLISAQPGPLQRRYVDAMIKSERVIAVSKFLAEHIRQTYPVEPSRIRLIPRGIDLRLFDPDNVRPHRLAQLARRWSLPDGVPVVMVAGRRDWVGNGVLLEALARQRDLPFRCLLVGAGEDATSRSELEGGIRDSGLADRVQLTGDCDDMPAAYMLADVVVSASNIPEAFVNVIAEAQAMGRPVVATCHDGVEEQVLRERTAWLVPPGEPEALAAAIAEALSLTPDQRFALGRAAIAHARACFGQERMCAQTLAVYRELLRTDAYAEGPAAA